MLQKLYRKIIPEKIRSSIYDLFLGRLLRYLRTFKVTNRGFFTKLFFPFLPNTLENQVYCFIGKHGFTDYPFESSLKYKKQFTQVYKDEELNLPYVLHNRYKLYFPENFSHTQVQSFYKNLLIEQDPLSPHRYITDNKFLTGKTLLDIGAAEGIFALDTIEYTKKVFLFEYDKDWISPLTATFRPWKEKVQIISQCIGNDETSLTIDNFLSTKNDKNLFIKMDIEGAELAALKGAEKSLTTRYDIFLAICTYHYAKDPMEISEYLKYINYEYEFTEGCLFVMNEVRSPVLVRAWKKQTAQEI